MLNICNQAVVQLVALGQHTEYLEARTHNCGRNRVREQVGTRTLTQQVDNLAATRRKTTDTTTKCLAKRAGDDINLTAQIEFLGHTATRRTYNTRRVALIDHHQRIVLLRQAADLVHRSHVAVHREDTVGHDDAEALRLSLLQTLLQLGHIGVGIAVALRLAQTHAIDDRSVVQRVRNDSVLLGQQGLEHTAVSVETSCIEDRVLGAKVLSNSCFELLVNILCAANKTHRRHTETVRVHRFFRRLDQARIVRKAQIVVGAEVQYLLVGHGDLGTLRRCDDALRFIKTRLANLGEGLLKMLFDFTVHSSVKL